MQSAPCSHWSGVAETYTSATTAPQMAPDLNSVPSSPFSPRQPSSIPNRSTSQNMAPPPIPPVSPRASIPSESVGEHAATRNASIEIGPGTTSIIQTYPCIDLHRYRASSSSKAIDRRRSTYATREGTRGCSTSSKDVRQQDYLLMLHAVGE